ncbi:NACHT domain-containing protein [Paractinoplanes rishiriensis]|uniref:NACHT domain-containing protein n=1 Tax=Paractinoplanes rishiriensis TaxID=1050105 RepID=UPI0019412CC9|nr:hypothetical protein [Actinoplanes rishiriensis]
MKLPLTYRSALRLMGVDEPGALRMLDTLLGGIILASGAAALPTGYAVLGQVWGWVDQKSEFLKILGRGVSWGRDRLGVLAGYERAQLIAAAHSVLVGEAVFHSLQQHLGPAYAVLKLTDEEKRFLFADLDVAEEYRTAVDAVLSARIEVPWAGCSFDENLEVNIAPYLRAGVARCLASFHKLAMWDRAWKRLGYRPTVQHIVTGATKRYEENYFRLASDVPEFLVWAMLGGQRATDRAIKAAGRDILGALHSQAVALNRIETVLSLVSRPYRPHHDLDALRKANRAILSQPLIKIGEMEGAATVSIPSIADGYITPRFRFAVVDNRSQPSSEEWWQDHPVRSDLDEFLIAYLASARSAEQPLVVLGHPGAGKSLLMRVLTARLSSTAFPAFLVPLRQVRAPGAPIFQQVQDVLDRSTHARARWATIAEAAAGQKDGGGGATRVVLLDGLDELMQATGTTESNYLSQVQDFQRTEMNQDAPVAVIVTSRQVVADIASIPRGCAVLRLEDFTDRQIEEWLTTWNAVNADAGGTPPGALSLQSVQAMGPIARQPLLLLMIAIQATASGGHTVAASETAVYHQLLVDFTRRELRKSDREERTLEPPPEPLVSAELWRLGIAAYGMFNRGRQFVTEMQLQGDLGALDPQGLAARSDRSQQVQQLSEARRTIGRFFFIHTSETSESDQSRKTYEFLHATFSEYLIAHHAVDRAAELIDAYDDYVNGRLRPGVPWDKDDVLFALLSHRPIADGAIVRFVHQLVDQLKPEVRSLGGKVLEMLLSKADRPRIQSNEINYNPHSRTTVQRLAAYVINLVLLRLLLVPDRSITLPDLAPHGQEPLVWWRSVVRLMQAGLEEATWLGVLQSIEPLVAGGVCSLQLRRDGFDYDMREVHEARLLFESDAADVAHVGVALWRGVPVPAVASSVQVYSDVLARRLFAAPSPASVPRLLADVRQVGQLQPPASFAVVEYVLTHCGHLSLSETAELVGSAVTSAPEAIRAVPVVVARPQLLHMLPHVADWYGQHFASPVDFARVAGALALLNLIGSTEEKDLGWPVYKLLLRTNAHLASMVKAHLIKKYASVAVVADEARPALLPAIVDSLTHDLIRHDGDRA